MNKSIVENLYGHNLKRSDRWTFIMKVIFLKCSKNVRKTSKLRWIQEKGIEYDSNKDTKNGKNITRWIWQIFILKPGKILFLTNFNLKFWRL